MVRIGRYLLLSVLFVFVFSLPALAVDASELADKAKKTVEAVAEGMEAVTDKITSEVQDFKDEMKKDDMKKEESPKIDTEKTKLAAGAVNAFALSLYGELAQKEQGNLFFSPYGILSALGMTYAGAGGATAEEMEKALHIPGYDIHASMGALMSRFDGIPEDIGALAVANRIWLADGEKLRYPYLKLLRDDYKSDVTVLDFAKDAETSRKTINNWVEEKTGDRIKDLLQSGDVNRDTLLVLTNAVYFNSLWRFPFDAKDTKPLPFYMEKGKSEDVPTMYREERFSYNDVDGVQLAKLPYRIPGLSMLILLPKATEKFDQLQVLEKKLAANNGLDTLVGWIAGMKTQRLNVWLPKFKEEQRFSLNENLEALGMKKAFGEEADFSGMLEANKTRGNLPVYINSVIHQTFVAVDEEKTEAAAATAVTIQKMSLALPEDTADFRADHAFLYLIMDDVTGTVLFIGRQTFN